MGWRPRSRGACGQMLSPVRSGAPPPATRQRGGGALRVDRGRGARPPVRPSCGACEISRPRQPRPPTAHSAPLLAAPRPPSSLSSRPLALCRMGRRPRSRGACGQMLSPVRSGAPPPAMRQRGGGARRVDRGRGARPPRSAELRSLRDQPPAPAQATHRHIAPLPSIPSPLLPDRLPSSVPPPPSSLLPASCSGHLLPCGVAASASDHLDRLLSAHVAPSLLLPDG